MMKDLIAVGVLATVAMSASVRAEYPGPPRPSDRSVRSGWRE
jgi:hypothetical protein